MITIKELKDFIKDLPNDMIVLCDDREEYFSIPVPLILHMEKHIANELNYLNSKRIFKEGDKYLIL